MQIAIIISAKCTPRNNRLKSLLDCLRSVELSAGYFLAKNCSVCLEIILIDDSSYPPLSSDRDIAGVNYLKILSNIGMPGQGGALNFGIKNAVSDLYLFTDSDCVVPEDWVAKHFEIHQKNSGMFGLVGPNYNFKRSANQWSRFLTKNEKKLMRHIFLGYVDLETMVTRRVDCRNLSLSAEIIENFSPGEGFFPVTDCASVSGLLSYKLQAGCGKSLKILLDPGIMVFHDPIYSIRNQMRNYYNRGYRSGYELIYFGEKGFSVCLFLRRYFFRHFISPVFMGRVNFVYLWLVHCAYWAGILRK